MADWQKIKTEYITTNCSYHVLAEKYGLHQNTIARRSKQEGWRRLRRQHADMTTTKAVEKISEKKARQAAKVCDLADKLLIKLAQAADELDLEDGTVDRAGLRQLTSALKELKVIKDEISELERQEREARLEALRRSSLNGDGDEDDTGIILLPPRREEDSHG